MKWTKEPPCWDHEKERLLRPCSDAFDLGPTKIGDPVPGEWWSLRNDAGEVAGLGWLDARNGDAELSLAVDQALRQEGHGERILVNLLDEARARGHTVAVGIVRSENRNDVQMVDWLLKRGFTPAVGTRKTAVDLLPVCDVALIRKL